jgi:uncharacterized 2Fe-2S/4Fe-4S cluster protein (DUF4445 family)
MKENYCDFNQHRMISDFHIKIRKEVVFHILDCHRESAVYDEVNAEFGELEEEAYSIIEPAALIHYDTLDPRIEAKDYENPIPVCYTIVTIGKKITDHITTYFNSGNYLAGMMLNAIADDYLFQLEDEVEKIIRKQCATRHIGVQKRLVSPTDIPMEAQKIILEKALVNKELDIELTKGYMFSPTKTNSSILILTEDENIMNMQHNCSACDTKNCMIRQQSEVNITVIRGNNTFTITCNMKESILSALHRNHVYFSADCGGNGTCGKCKVLLVKGDLEITAQDKKKFTDTELQKGYRLTCCAYPAADCTIRFDLGDESDFQIVSDYQFKPEQKTAFDEEGYGIAVDIGTTTIVISLVGLASKSIVQNYTTINKQRAYGADVISRIQAANEGKGNTLRNLIRKDLLEGFAAVILAAGIDKSLIRRIAIAGNTTMGHLLMGYSCEALGVYPFTPVNIARMDLGFQEVFDSDYLAVPVTLLPGISTYVGADITAGLITSKFDERKLPSLLIDLGTNGEMAIGNRERILVTSTAAGPAFEGGNITCGTGSVAGAICSVTIEEDGVSYKTINDKPPMGICGTGVVEITSEIVRTGIIDETGLLIEKYFEKGYVIADNKALDEEQAGSGMIIFTQKDIREIQLAKAAIRAGIETLIKRYGISCEQIDTVFLAGGFGYKINIEKAVNIGLFPKELAGKIMAIGNSSLAGAIQELTDETAKEKMDQILAVSEEISLSGDKEFNELYIEYLLFE